MDPLLMYGAGMAISAGIGAIGNWLAGSKDEEERQQRLAALQEYSALSAPDVKDLIAQGVKESAMSSVRADDGQRADQDEVQQRLLSRGRGETSMAYRARTEGARMDAARRASGDREAILQEGRARGTVGSGEELLLQQDANQAAAEQERMAGIQSLADEEDAALRSLIAGGNMAGQREERDWNQQADVARAEDEIAMFNTGETNRFSLYNDQQRWQRFDAQMDLANARANAHNGLANQSARDADRTRSTWGGVGQAAGYGIAAGAQYAGQQPKPGVTSRPATPGETAAPATIGTNAALGGASKQDIQTRRKAR